jgi:hypothetical protein
MNRKLQFRESSCAPSCFNCLPEHFPPPPPPTSLSSVSPAEMPARTCPEIKRHIRSPNAIGNARGDGPTMLLSLALITFAFP